MVIITHKVHGFYKPTYKSGPHLVSISDNLCILEGFPIAIYVDSKVFLPFLGLHPGEMMRAIRQPGNGGFTIFTCWYVYVYSGWWFGTCMLWLSIYWEFHHPTWRTHIFQRGRYTTNQYLYDDVFFYMYISRSLSCLLIDCVFQYVCTIFAYKMIILQRTILDYLRGDHLTVDWNSGESWLCLDCNLTLCWCS